MLLLIAVGAAVAFLLLYWFSRKNRGFGEGIAQLVLLVASFCNAVHDELMKVYSSVREYLPSPMKANNEEHEEEGKDKKGRAKPKVDTLHHKAHSVVSDMVAAFVGFIIIAADTYMAYVFNSSLFNTHEVSLSGGLFEWAASLLWIATPAMFGIVALECAGIVKSSGLFPRLAVGWRILVGVISFLLMCLSIFLVMYAYSFRGVKIFDPTNTYQLAQMGESTLQLLGILVGAASIPALVALINGLSTLLTILLFALLVGCFLTAKLLHVVAIVLDRIAISYTDGRIRVFEEKETPAPVAAVSPAPEIVTITAAVERRENEKTEQDEIASSVSQLKTTLLASASSQPAAPQDTTSAYSWFLMQDEPGSKEKSNGHIEPGDDAKKKIV